MIPPRASTQRQRNSRSVRPPVLAAALAPAAPVSSLNEQAYRRLEELIVTLQLTPGSVVSEASLSERIGIGTTPIREALQRLAREHLVQILPRRGVIVTQIDVRLQLQVLETRRELDRLIARCAARRSTAAECGRMADIARRMAHAAKAGDLHHFLEQDADMNALAALAARNDVAAQALAALHSVSRRFWFFHHERWPGATATMRLHVALAEAIASGSDERAAAASDALIDDLDNFARSTLARV